MTVKDLAVGVLETAGEPLHYQEIARRILDAGLWQTKGKTPAATVGAQMYVEIKERGEAARFRSLGKGMFGLNAATSAMPAVSTPPAAIPNRNSEPFSFTDAAERVLERFGNRKPMHYRDITEKALEQGLISTKGKTPEATMRAAIITEMQRQHRRGERPRFSRNERGYVGLTRWRGEGLTAEVERHNRDIRGRLFARLRQMAPDRFETLIGTLLGKLGFSEVEVTARSGDGGIDVRGTLVVGDVIRTRMAVQVKRWKNNVQTPVVQQVRGSLGAHEQGLIITTSDFSSGARNEAARADATPVALMNGEELVNLLIENDIGVRRVPCDLLELAELEEDP